MISIEIRPEYNNSGLKLSNQGTYLEWSQDFIPDHLFAEIVNFNNSYLPYARLSEGNKKLFWEELFELDRQGYDLARKVEKSTNGNVRYFSEALLKYLDTAPRKKDYEQLPFTFVKKIKRYFVGKSIKSDDYGFYSR